MSDLATTDLLMYRHAASRTGKQPDDAVFHAGHARGEFRFSTDPRLLGELLVLHTLNLHQLSGEWLAFRDGRSAYGATPGEAVCRWVLSHSV